MKILLVSEDFSKNGGVPRYAVGLAQELVKDNEVHLLTSHYQYNIPKLIVHKKTNKKKKPVAIQIFLNSHINMKYSQKLKKQFEIDIIHTIGAQSISTEIVTMPALQKAKNKALNKITFKKQHFYKNTFSKYFAWIKPINIAYLTIDKKVLEKNSNIIIAISQSLKNDIIENYHVQEDKIAVIPCGIDLDEFNFANMELRKTARDSIGIKENEMILMFIGHEFEEKGLQYLIKALPILDNNITFKLLVIGGGNQHPQQDLANSLGVCNKIKFLGPISGKLVKNYFIASDILVLPTLYEAFGMVILEAMAQGTPVIVSKLAGAAELINNEDNGLLLNDPTNSEEIADRINFLAKNEDVRDKIRKSAKKTAEEYSWENITKKIIEVYNQLLI